MIPTKEECTIFVRTVQANVIKACVEILKDIIFEATLIFCEDGIKLTSMDSSKTSLVYLKLESDSFEEYVCTSQTPVGVSLLTLYKLAKTASSNDVITLYMKKSTPYELGILIESSSNKTNFSLKVLDLSVQDITLPNFEYDHVINLNSGMFQRLVRDMQYLGQNVTLRSNGKVVNLSCIGDFASQETVLGEDDGEGGEMTFNSTYSLKYLSLFSKASNLANTLTLYIHDSHPLILEFDVGSLGTLKFLLSPIVED
jgi:proliferating cell nuclear antigen